MQKKYVSVNAEVDTDGVIRPLLIRWHDGRQWEVTKVLHTCTASHDEFEGVRYTVKIGFIADGVTPLRVYEGGTVVRRVYPRGTIVIERCLRREHESGRRRFTISHECAHYIMDRAVPSAAFHREFDNERIYSQEDFKNLFSFRETQVDRMGAALLMPRFMVHNVALMHGCTDRIPVYGDSVLRTADKLRIKQMANAMGVSFSAFLIRLRELGCLCYRPLAEYITEEMGLGQDGGAG